MDLGSKWLKYGPVALNLTVCLFKLAVGRVLHMDV